jgi:NAD(P)-dependent dehydrogenase (short-subunit alcohol dehydrogenase family)
MRLEGKTGIVTGASQGIGHALIEGLASDGASVVVADVQGADAAAKDLRKKGYKAIGLKVDVSSEEDTARMAAETVKAFGRIDVLVNNAGIWSSLVPTPFEKLSVAEWRKVLDVNVLGIFLCSRACLEELKKNRGHIINIASGVPFLGIPDFLHYVASKGAVVGMTRAMAAELGKYNIPVNAVAPGFCMSAGVEASPILIEHFRQVSIDSRPMTRDLLPEDLVGAVKFFAGPESSFITGQTLLVDGGAFKH